ncbi:HEAT repeat domain-containing protein [Acrocarpospora macrocephala]|nr:HEAT repeat domain-containing protein [Acrocarpospora macrocephala]
MDSIQRLVHLAVRGRRAALDDLAGALFSAVADDQLAGQALDVVTTAGPKLWIELDGALRPWLYGYRDPRVTLAPIVQRMGNPLAVALAACGRDGRERERSVGHPLMVTDVRLLPVLAIRAVDWIPVVQDEALRVLSEAFTPPDAAALRAIVPMAARLGERRRGRPLAELARQALLRADDDTLDAVRRCEDLRGRRFAFDVSLQAGRMDWRQLAAAALHESDIISRRRCAQVLAAQAIDGNRPELVEELLESTSARVRVEALTALVQLGRTDYGPQFLDDNASMVRLTAQWAVRRAREDPADFYRHRLVAAGNGRGLLAGLGDCGTVADADLVLPYLEDPRPRVRAEAVRTLRRLGAKTDLGGMLEDPAPVVVRQVVTTLRSLGPRVPVERLWALLGPGHPRHVRHAAHRLLVDRDPWTRIRADLRLAGDPDEALSLGARTDLAMWRSRDAAGTYASCPDELRDEVANLLSRVEAAVGVDTARVLRWLIRTGS